MVFLKHEKWLRDCWLPALLLIGVYFTCEGVANFFQELTLAPALSLISLFILSLVRTPSFVAAWIPLFTALTFYLIYPHSQYPWTRATTLVLGGAITVYAAYLRTRTERLLYAHEKIFSSLPFPLLVSDTTSRILFFNREASEVLKISPGELENFSWFNLIYDRGDKAKDIERYVRLGLSDDPAAFEQFDLVGLDGRIWSAKVTKELDVDQGRLITSLAEQKGKLPRH